MRDTYFILDLYYERIAKDNTGDVITRRKKFDRLVQQKVSNLNKRRAARPRRLANVNFGDENNNEDEDGQN